MYRDVLTGEWNTKERLVCNMFDAKKVTEELVEWIKKYFDKLGGNQNAVIGISGGIDSSTVAALCVKALGEDRVRGVLMPYHIQPDINVSLNLVHYLGIRYSIVNIGHTVDTLRKENAKQGIEETEQANINLPARVRMSELFFYAQCCNGIPTCNCNLSEDHVGFATYGGDGFGSFAPIEMLTKTEVRAVAKELGLPDEFVNKTPIDGLCGKTDEESFGFSYEVLDKYIRTGEIDDQNVKRKIDEMHEKNLFKLKPMGHYEYTGE